MGEELASLDKGDSQCDANHVQIEQSDVPPGNPYHLLAQG